MSTSKLLWANQTNTKSTQLFPWARVLLVSGHEHCMWVSWHGALYLPGFLFLVQRSFPTTCLESMLILHIHSNTHGTPGLGQTKQVGTGPQQGGVTLILTKGEKCTGKLGPLLNLQQAEVTHRPDYGEQPFRCVWGCPDIATKVSQTRGYFSCRQSRRVIYTQPEDMLWGYSCQTSSESKGVFLERSKGDGRRSGQNVSYKQQGGTRGKKRVCVKTL